MAIADNQKAALRLVADNVFAYYTAMCSAGFSQMQALQLAEAWITALTQKSPELSIEPVIRAVLEKPH